MPKLCDSCQAANAILFCRADAAYLCKDCDAKVHGVNKLALRHERVWMCEVCEQAAASVTCKADAAALCVGCDKEVHAANSLASRHERAPLAPFYECPPDMVKVAHVNALRPSSRRAEGAIQVQEHPLRLRNEEDERSVAEAASWLLSYPRRISSDAISEDEVAADSVADENEFNCQLPSRVADDSLVPVHAPEMFGQFSTSTLDGSHWNEAEVPHEEMKRSLDMANSTFSRSLLPSEIEAVRDTNGNKICATSNGLQGIYDVQSPPRSSAHAAALEPLAREARVLRYKEKRKNRKFHKTIRYASRKAYAEIRPRVRGRFAKRSDEQMYELLPDNAFGIVPSL
ncbi:hypothetical protein O6H91_02G072600 [Diphasiastrum complanatum]|uniref:Uncharacterized protein n=1 Tax=Diphasiastrum complanatum TaxID=34168 RepID=A0ACC2EH15_DIPCM|nr:hypothetical protein O6H91_02G072600 [Diphasiastrum complanatum]